MKYKKILCVLLLIVVIFTANPILASNIQQNKEETNEVNDEINIDTNDINNLNNQINEVNEKLENANIQLEYVQEKMSETLLKIQELDDKIRKYEQENKQMNTRLKQLAKSINETNEKLKIVTEDYNKKEKQLKERLVVLYECGSLSYIEVLLSANSLSEFLSIYYKMVEIAEYDNQLIDKVAEEKKIIEDAMLKLETETAEIKTLKAEAEKKEIIYKNTKVLQQSYIAKLSDNEKELNEQIAKYKTDVAILEAKIRAITMPNSEFNIQYTGGVMIWPVAISGSRITSYYGTREHPVEGVIRLHQGIDIGSVGYGAPVVAAMDGVVTYSGELGTYGNCVIIQHGHGIVTLYAHGQKVLKEYGEEVKQGDIIMETGSTGRSTGPHLHFEVRIDGITIDPLIYVEEH